MAFNGDLALVLFISSLIIIGSAHLMEASRDLPMINPGHNLEARLALGEGGGLVECWNSLLELRSCSKEIVLFFLNGESYIGLECCRAIRVITRHCWPSMLTSLGFTAQEGDILRGYCDASANDSAPPTPTRPVQPPAAVAPDSDVKVGKKY